ISKGQQLRIPNATEVIDIAAFREAQKRDRIDPKNPPKLDDGAYHFLADGETIWNLARLYEVSMDTIMERNGFDDDAVVRLRPGDAVIVPGVRAAKQPEKGTERPQGIAHTMERGETVWDLARLFKVSVAEIMGANALNEAQVTQLREGSKLFIPGVTEDKRGRITRRVTRTQEKASAV